jgi:hypothetical protein
VDFEKLLRLMSIYREDLKWHESWDEHWDWLYDMDYVSFDEKEILELTERGRVAVNFAVKKAGEV